MLTPDQQKTKMLLKTALKDYKLSKLVSRIPFIRVLIWHRLHTQAGFCNYFYNKKEKTFVANVLQPVRGFVGEHPDTTHWFTCGNKKSFERRIRILEKALKSIEQLDLHQIQPDFV